MNCAALPLRKSFDVSKKRMKMLKRIVLSAVRETLTRSLYTVREKELKGKEVRDLIVAVPGMLGLAAVQNPMRTKRIDGRQSQIVRRTIAKPMLQIHCYPLVGGAIEVTEFASLTESANWIGPIDVEMHLRHAMIARGGTGTTNVKDSTEEEQIREQALMTCHTVMRNLVEVGDGGLIAILKVRAAEEILRFVACLEAFILIFKGLG